MTVEIDMTGLQELVDKIEAMGKQGAKVQNEALKKAAEPVAKDMASLVNVSTINELHIKNDIKVSNVKTQNGRKVILVGPGKKTNWRAKFLELGTSRMAAKPFMAPAYEKNKENIKAIIKQKLKEGLGI